MIRTVIGSIYILLAATVVHAEGWKLPVFVDSTNTTVKYVVDSTWHTVHGVVQKPAGKLWLSNPLDPLSVKAELTFPVASFDSGSTSRDKKMLRVMHTESFPEVSFKSSGLGKECPPAKVKAAQPCKSSLNGLLTISGVSKDVDIPISINKAAGDYLVQGELPIKWAEYGVEDPSILIAKLDPVVTVSFEIRLRENN
jgi:polyisoprenoid-binding protein YceI